MIQKIQEIKNDGRKVEALITNWCMNGGDATAEADNQGYYVKATAPDGKTGIRVYCPAWEIDAEVFEGDDEALANAIFAEYMPERLEIYEVSEYGWELIGENYDELTIALANR